MMLASASGNARSTARRSRPAGNGFLRFGLVVSPIRAFAVMNAEQVADVNDAFGVVERFVVDHEPRMRRALEQAHELAERNIPLHRDDVGAVHHRRRRCAARCRPRMLRNMVRSMAEKPTSSGVEASSTT